MKVVNNLAAWDTWEKLTFSPFIPHWRGLSDLHVFSVTVGLAAKEKREKDEKSSSASKYSLPPRPPTRRGRTNDPLSNSVSSSIMMSVMSLYHKLIPSKLLCSNLQTCLFPEFMHMRKCLILRCLTRKSHAFRYRLKYSWLGKPCLLNCESQNDFYPSSSVSKFDSLVFIRVNLHSLCI